MPTTEIYKKIVEMDTPQLFDWLKEAKKLRGLTNKNIAEATGVPQGTIDRIMAGKYTEVKRSTLQPITAYLAKLHEDTLPPDTQEQAELNTNALEGLKMVVQIRDAELKALNDAYDHIKKGYYNLREDFDKAAVDNKAKIDYLKDRVEYLKQENKRKDKWVAILAALTIVLFTGIIALLVYDLTHPDIGWYQPVAEWFSSLGAKM